MSLSQVEGKGAVRIDLSGRNLGFKSWRQEQKVAQEPVQLGQVYKLRTLEPVSIAANPKQPA